MASGIQSGKRLYDELVRLNNLDENSDIEIDIEQFLPEEQGSARLLSQLLNHRRFKVDQAAPGRTELSNESCINTFPHVVARIARWEISVVAGKFSHPENRLILSKEYLQILGYVDENEEGVPTTLSEWDELLHPDDRSMVRINIAEHGEDPDGSTPQLFDCRMRTKNGDYIHLHSMAVKVKNDSGLLIRIEGMVEDVTSKVQLQLFQENMLNAMDTHIFVSDIDTDEILFANHSLIKAFHFDTTIIGKKCWQCFQLNQTERCPWCKKGELSENPEQVITWEHHYKRLGMNVQKIDRMIDWSDNRRVHIQQSFDISSLKRAGEELIQREKMLDILNSLSILLITEKKKTFSQAIVEGINLLASTAKFHRMSVFRNSEQVDGLHASQIFRWVKQSGRAVEPLKVLEDITYADTLPWWDKILETGKCINSPAHLMERADLLERYGLNIVLAVPIINNSRFWGFVIFENLADENLFSAYEVDLLRSASYVLTNAIIGNGEKTLLREADERARLMLDATPLACRLWDKNFNIVECNEAVVKLYELKDKSEYIKRFFDLLPEFQPDGQKSIDKIYNGVKTAFATGHCSYEVVFQLLDGTPIPAENVLYRVRYGDDYVVAAYSRDMRVQKKMMSEIASTSAQLEDALAEAEIANRAKSSFLARMSHEIRTPMNAILGITEILVQDDALQAETVLGLNRIYKSCTLLMGIINDILDLSKIEAGKLDISPNPYKLASLINDSINLNVMNSDNKSIDFTLEIDDNINANLIGDELRIKQILNNLLSNAFKYTDCGIVTLQVEVKRRNQDNVMLILTVTDTGHGMTEQQLEKLFEEYTRFQPDSRRSIEGTGLGMAITKRLIALMDGDIQVESELGRGSTFTVSLPQGLIDDEVMGAELTANLRNFRNFLFSDSDRRPLVRESMPYGKVLIVDDMETNLYVTESLLKLYDIQVDTAMNGYDALDMIRAGSSYNIVLMDHMMPMMDGIETTRHLRGLGYREPIVALTANAVADQADLFLNSGFDDYLAKPIDIRQLDALLNRLIREKQPTNAVEKAKKEYKNDDWAADGNAIDSVPVKSLLASFLHDTEKAIFQLETWHINESDRSDEDFRQLAGIAHGIKSALANVGNIELSNIAQELENAVVQADNSRTYQIVPCLLEQLRAITNSSSDDHIDADITDADFSYLRERLVNIQQLCKTYDRKGIMDILDELEQEKCSRQTHQILRQIAEAILYSEYEDAAAIASNLANNICWLGADIVGIDLERGLDKCEGDENTYTKILNSYSSSLISLLKPINSVTEESLEEYRLIVHGIKGASFDIFADDIGHRAASLEEAAKALRLDYINEHHMEFCNAALDLSERIKKLLARIERTVRGKKDKPDEEALQRLLMACELCDMDDVDAAMDSIDEYEYEEDDGLVTWLREKVDAVDFSSITERLSN